jgi:hypothetical protein
MSTILKVLCLNPNFHTSFFINYLRQIGLTWRAHVAEEQGWPAHVAARWGGRLACPCGRRRGVVGPHGGRVHVDKLNLNLNMSLNSAKIWNKFGEI